MTDDFLTRRQFHSIAATTAFFGAPLLTQTELNAAATDPSSVGPMVGHVSATEANIWFRPGKTGSYRLVVTESPSNRVVSDGEEKATADTDYRLQWAVDSLKPSTTYHYSIFAGDAPLALGGDLRFRTSPSPETPSCITLALGSCADTKPLKLWRQIEEAKVDGLVLLGDTPYIDSTNLARARQRHREFLQIPELASLIRKTPTWGTWDDHDFGGNNTDGRLKGKANTRKAFVEYRANREYGNNGEGIYTRFRKGPVEVFLLDTRWFARTAPSPVDPNKPTLLGKRQWDWLKAGLKASSAPFKLIACGMIWDDKQNRESDDWGTYTHERAALFKFLGQERISGVLLVGGDIHCSRLLKYQTNDVVGYPMHQLIVSPIHARTIPALNVAHPDLVHGEAVPHVWLHVKVDDTQTPACLHAEWRQMDGQKMWDLTVTADELSDSST